MKRKLGQSGIVQEYKCFASFPFVLPVRYAPPVTEHVSLHSKSSCKNMALSWWRVGQTEKDPRSGTIGPYDNLFGKL